MRSQACTQHSARGPHITLYQSLDVVVTYIEDNLSLNRGLELEEHYVHNRHCATTSRPAEIALFNFCLYCGAQLLLLGSETIDTV